MSEKTKQKIRRLLQPTDAQADWHREVATLKVDEAVPVLVEILRSQHETLLAKEMTIMILGQLKDKNSEAALVEALKLSNPVLRGLTAKALGGIYPLSQNAIDKLIECIGDSDDFVRECSAKALGGARCEDALQVLEQMSTTDSLWTNREIAKSAIKAIREAN